MLKNALAGLSAVVAGPALAQQCKSLVTPTQTKGPFYPRSRVADQNFDLVQVEGAPKEAEGRKVLIRGVVMDQLCQTVPGALVDLWQACASGKYNHPSDPNPAKLDPNFQYSAQINAGTDGSFTVRTIIPGAYPADVDWMRPPHIHIRLAKLGYRELISQVYFDTFKDLNGKDLILQALTTDEQDSVIMKMRTPQAADLQMGDVDMVGDLVITMNKILAP